MICKNDQAALGHFVRACSPEHELRLNFPTVTIKSFALELAEMLREVLPALELSVVSSAITGSLASLIETATQRSKRRVIEAREAEYAGAAFIDGINYWTFDSKPYQE